MHPFSQVTVPKRSLLRTSENDKLLYLIQENVVHIKVETFLVTDRRSIYTMLLFQNNIAFQMKAGCRYVLKLHIMVLKAGMY